MGADNRVSDQLRVKPLAAQDASPLLAEPMFGLPTSWSREDILLFTRIDGNDVNSSDVFSVSLTGERTPREFRATPAREQGAVFSSDGRWVAYSSNDSAGMTSNVAAFRTHPTRSRSRLTAACGRSGAAIDGSCFMFRCTASRWRSTSRPTGPVSGLGPRTSSSDQYPVFEPIACRSLRSVRRTVKPGPMAELPFRDARWRGDACTVDAAVRSW